MSGSGGIQTSVNTLQTPAVAGDWCDSNPRYSFDAAQFGLVAGSAGLTVGRFAWVEFPGDSDGTPALAFNSPLSTSSTGGLLGLPAGFVHRENQAVIVNYLADASMVIPSGYEVTLTTSAGVWAQNDGSTDAQVGQKAFASIADGKVSFAATGSIAGGSSGATSAIAQQTFSVTGSISGNILTVTANSSGGVYPGAALTSNGVGTVVAVLTGTPTGTGTFLLSMGEQSVAAGTTIGGAYGEITFGTVTGANFAVGMVLSGTGVVTSPPTVITYSITGGGTGGTMVVNNDVVVGSTTIVGSSVIETSFVARSAGLPGELVKMSNQPTP